MVTLILVLLGLLAVSPVVFVFYCTLFGSTMRRLRSVDEPWTPQYRYHLGPYNQPLRRERT